jgi:hypothetical protein
VAFEELTQSYTEDHRVTQRKKNEISQWLSVVLCGSLCNKKTKGPYAELGRWTTEVH